MQPAPLLSEPPPLRQLARDAAPALFLDFDGTLVDIAPTHDAISVAPGLPAALEALSARLEERAAIVSGRSLDDLARHLGPLSLAQAGSHGADCLLASGERVGPAPPELPHDALAAMRDFAARHEGVSIEAKPHGAAIHYRARPAAEAEVQAQAERFAQQFGLRLKRGKCVVELVSASADKGAAVAGFMRVAPFAGAHPVFIGDDLTDEDGFRAVAERGGFGILVGEPRATAARFRLAGPHAVHQWLELETT